MKYGEIKKIDIANGPGVRVSLFVSGCTHHCKGCFNPETWDFEYGNVFTEDTQEQIFEMLAPDYIAGLTVLGGEPFEPDNQRALLPFLKEERKRYPQKNIWCSTELIGRAESRAVNCIKTVRRDVRLPMRCYRFWMFW